MTAVWFETALLQSGWAAGVRITHRDGLITGVETRVAAAPGDDRHAIGLPGLGNLHSHAFQRGMAGLAETRDAAGDDFWTWREVMYRFVERLTPRDVTAIAAQAYAEMLESGFTRVGEFHYLHHDADGAPFADPAEMATAIAEAAHQTGIGLTLLPVFYAQAGFGGRPTGLAQRRFAHSPEGFAALLTAARRSLSSLPDAVVGMAPHSLRAVSPRDLAAILPMSNGAPIHIHIAEQRREVEDCLAWSGQRPVEWLLDHAPVDDRWCLVHATHMTEQEARALARSGAVAGLCPITEANLGDGVFPAAMYLAAGGRFGIGSDSNVLIDAAEELRLLEYGQRLTRRSRAIIATADRPSVGGSLFSAARDGASRALGVATGAIAPGAPLDALSLRRDHPAFVGRTGDAVLDGWIFAARGGAVDTVWRRGEKVVVAGRHIRDEAIGEAFRQTLQRILAT